MLNSQLIEKIKEFECRIGQLEDAQLAFNPDNLLVELDALTQRNVAAYYGPDMIEHLEFFNGYHYCRVCSTCTTFVPTMCRLGQGRCQSQSLDMQEYSSYHVFVCSDERS